MYIVASSKPNQANNCIMKSIKLYTVLASIIVIIILYGSSTFVYYSIKNFYFSFSGFASLLLPVIAITGLIISFSSGFKKTALLRLFLCIEIFSFPFTVLFYIKHFTGSDEFGGYRPHVPVQFIIGIFLTLIMTTCSAILLWHLSREKKPKLTFVQYGEEKFGQFEPAGKWLRFTNRLIDAMVIVYFLYNRLVEGRLLPRSEYTRGYAALFLVEGIMLIAFYLLLEGIFNTTPGKCATNTVIVNENGERPNFGQILGRTFCRLIPFDALSFLGAGTRGWHDSLSGTYVVPAANSNEEAINEITLDAELNQQQ